jgi:uncharacterized protein YicC (UPF0701 family)
MTQKVDITEERDRISRHSDEIKRILNTGGAAVEIKVLIEQIREQIQNIE